MDRRYSSNSYTSTKIQDDEAGLLGVELHVVDGTEKSLNARVIYWDAVGQFYVETFGEVPLVVLEDLVREAKGIVPN